MSSEKSATTTVTPTFSALGRSLELDSRLLRALAAQGFTHPTPVQAAVLPLALAEGRDILARARTGSGKTLAYGLPLIQKILRARARLEDGFTSPDYLSTRALVLVPTRELAEQVTTHISKLAEFLNDQDAIRVVNVSGASTGSGSGKGKANADKLQKMHLADRPDVVVATPSRALVHLRAETLDLSHLECLVIDEADLILSYGHSSDDIRSLLSGGSTWSLPGVYQSFLMSATLTGEVDELKSVVLRNPALVKLPDTSSSSAGGAGSEGKLTQYIIRTSEDDKFLLAYVILKLKLVKGKILIFVNDTDRGYRLKLFLEKFGIRSGVLNAELPFNSRYHAVQEFNRGVFNYLIATDESGLEGLEKDSEDEADDTELSSALISTQVGGEDLEQEQQDGDEQADEDPDAASTSASSGKKRKASEMQASSSSSKKKKRKNKTTAQTEYGVTRGIDFVDVACVLNFDLPGSARAYTHRVGRTARAGRSGQALSFVVPKSKWGPAHQKGGFDTSLKSAKADEKVWRRIEREQRGNGVGPDQLQEYRFDMTQVEGFRYRMEDGLRSVTRAYVREARIKEIKNEVLNSDKLKAHFEDNPKDLAFLKHDKPLNPARVQKHMKHVPSYLMPRIAPVGGTSTLDNAAQADSSSNADNPTAGSSNAAAGDSKYVPYKKGGGSQRGGKGGRGGRGGRGGKTGGSKRSNPLKSFKRK